MVAIDFMEIDDQIEKFTLIVKQLDHIVDLNKMIKMQNRPVLPTPNGFTQIFSYQIALADIIRLDT